MIGMDTSTIIDLFNGDPKLIYLLNSIDEELCVSLINYQEIIFGLNPKDENHIEELMYYDNLFDNYIVFSLSKKDSKKANEIYWLLNEKGIAIGKFDCMIAGILLENGVNKLITKNVKHFSKIPNLKVISY
ncbi:MAG: type II toxin-antitoxin system VapC family toxin [Nanoarchaeota archaeon]